jgi:hypothetical protein
MSEQDAQKARSSYHSSETRGSLRLDRATVGSIDGAGPFHELLISLSFDEGRRDGQQERVACA